MRLPFIDSICYIDVPFMAGRDRRGRGRMLVGFTTTSAISAYHH